MKGGRLHRPEPPPGPHSAAAAAAPVPADDWVDGSWTVDCSCGVTFDDGEEMVSCDDCNVWVHTRCARYLRGVHTSFTCHNCRRSSKRNASAVAAAAASPDEAEVAELLAELPTHRPPPLYRRWAEVPLPARVHVHGVPGGGSEAALFRGAPSVFSTALWRSAGYVPKKFGFRYCEFPSWCDDKDGADALFALAREKPKEKPEARVSLRIGAVQKKENNSARTLSKKADANQRVGHDGAEQPRPRTEAKKKGQSISAAAAEDLAVPDVMREDQPADIKMVSFDLEVVVKTNKKMEESVERSGEKKSADGILGRAPPELKPKESIRLESSSRIRTATAVAEREVYSRSVKAEVSICKQQIEGNQYATLQPGITDSAVKVEAGNPSNGNVQIHAGSEKMHEGLVLQKQLNQTSSNLQVLGGEQDLQIGQPKSQNNKSEVASQDHERTESTQFISDVHKSDKQGLGGSAGSLDVQRNSAKLVSNSEPELPNSEAQNHMHTVPKKNSILGVPKVCTASSGSASTNFELPRSSVSTDPSSAGKTARFLKKEHTRPVSPADNKHDSVKYSAETSEELSRFSEKSQPKGSLPSAPKSSQTGRSYMSSAKHRLPVPKEQSQKTSTTGGTPAKSFQGETTPLHSRNKSLPSSFSQKKDKIHPRFVHTTLQGSSNSTSTELRASDATASLSDEQLALLLHQQLNSSPRVPRVPRGHQAANMQGLHATGASVFSKRSSAHGGRDQTPVLKKRNKDDTLRDNDDTKKSGKASLVERRHKDCSTGRVASVNESCRLADNMKSEQQHYGISSNETTTGLAKDDGLDSGVSCNVSGLIDKIISKNRNITYRELCDAVRQHWRDSVKPNGEDYEYYSYLHAVDDCLRNRSEWAHLVDQDPKVNPNKRRNVESETLQADVLDTDKTRNRAERDPEEGSPESQDGLPRGKRKARKRRRLELKGRRVKDARKKPSIGSSSEDAAANMSCSSSDRNDTLMDDESQEDKPAAGYMEPKSGADSSS